MFDKLLKKCYNVYREDKKGVDLTLERKMEIERKFLVSDKSFLTIESNSSEIEQHYISIDPEVRVRKEDGICTLTIKSSGELSREEAEVVIPLKYFDNLKSVSVGSVIKTRYRIPHNEHILECDVYHSVPNLMTVEVEFDSEFEAKAFIPPHWFGKEVTYDSNYKNKNLITLREDD